MLSTHNSRGWGSCDGKGFIGETLSHKGPRYIQIYLWQTLAGVKDLAEVDVESKMNAMQDYPGNRSDAGMREERAGAAEDYVHNMWMRGFLNIAATIYGYSKILSRYLPTYLGRYFPNRDGGRFSGA